MRHPLVRAGVVACFIAAAVLAFATAIWWPAQRTYADLMDRVSTGRHVLDEARQAGELAKIYAQDVRDVPQIEGKLEAAVDQTQIVDGLGRLAHEHGVRLMNQTYAERRDKANVGGLVVELAVEGRYTAIRNFIRGMPTLLVWIEVQEVQLDQAGDEGTVKGKLRMVSFRRSVDMDKGGT